MLINRGVNVSPYQIEAVFQDVWVRVQVLVLKRSCLKTRVERLSNFKTKINEGDAGRSG